MAFPDPRVPDVEMARINFFLGLRHSVHGVSVCRINEPPSEFVAS